MIFDGKTAGAPECQILDADTGEEIDLVVRVDSETGFVERGVLYDGFIVHIEERRNFRVIHKPSGRLVCQHPR